jgi:predicted RNA binding protein YcfA (HicA-like mRNA interferase family)
MKSISGQRLGKILESKGWTLKNIKGSHHVYVKAGRKERISVPVHGSSDLKRDYSYLL